MVVLRSLAGIRAGESAASPSRTSGFSPSGYMPTRPCAWTSKPAPRRSRTHRFSLTVAGAAQVDPVHCRWAPCFPFNCMRTSAHTSTKVRASLGRAPRAVKETRASTRPFHSAGAACRVLSYARVWCPHMRSHVQLNGKQAALAALNLCCPRNGKRPAAFEPHMSFEATVRRARMGRQRHEAASPDTGQTRGRTSASNSTMTTPNAGSAGDRRAAPR